MGIIEAEVEEQEGTRRQDKGEGREKTSSREIKETRRIPRDI